MAPAGSVPDGCRCFGGRRRMPRARGRAPCHADIEEGGHGHGEASGSCHGACLASPPPPVVEDEAEATVYHSANRWHREDQENEGSLHTHLIGEWSSK